MKKDPSKANKFKNSNRLKLKSTMKFRKPRTSSLIVQTNNQIYKQTIFRINASKIWVTKVSMMMAKVVLSHSEVKGPTDF